jgi:hypothetical protein
MNGLSLSLISLVLATLYACWILALFFLFVFPAFSLSASPWRVSAMVVLLEHIGPF